MLRFLRKGQRWLTALIVASVGVVFAVFIGLGGSPLQGTPGGSIVAVGPYRFGLPEFERVRAQREQEIRDAAGDAWDPRRFEDPLNDFAARALVDRAILALEAEELGLTVSNKEIERVYLASGDFRGEDGRFDREAFDDFVQYNFGSWRAFLNDRRLAFLASKMIQLVYDLPRVTEAEARASLELRLEEIRAAYVAIDPAAISDNVEVTDADVEAFLVEREDEARGLYDARGDQYDVPEQVRARHILLRVPPGLDEAGQTAIEERAKEIRAQIQDGDNFAALAEELSEDPGSKAQGGDLGFFPRGRMVKPFEEVAFSLPPGTLSDVVKSDFGYHVILVEERKEARFQPFEEVREELARELLGLEGAQLVVRQTADGLAARVREGADLEDAVREEGLTLERTGWLRRRPDGFVPGLGAAQDLLTAAFALEPGQSSPVVFEVGEKLALVKLVERTEAEETDIQAKLEEEQTQLLDAKRNAFVEAWLSARRTKLADAGQIQVDLAALR